MKKKPLCVQELAHGRGENGEANWISSIATMFNTDVVASGKCPNKSIQTNSPIIYPKLKLSINCVRFVGWIDKALEIGRPLSNDNAAVQCAGQRLCK